MRTALSGMLRPRSLASPVRYATGGLTGLLGSQTARTMESQMAAMGTVGTLFAIVDLLANSVASVNWRLWRLAKSGKPEDRVEITRHLALEVLNKPNPFMGRQEFLEVGGQHYELTGEQWWVIVSDARMPGVPVELWPIRPDRMLPVPSKEAYLQGYLYIAPDGERVPLELHQVIFLRRPNPLDPYRGMSPVQALLSDLDATKYASQWNRNFFLNSAEPGGVIEVEKRLSDGEWNEMVSRWSSQHKGVANAHRVAVIEAGKWVPRAFSQRDMQFTELRTITRDTVMEAFRINKIMLGIMEDGNRAQATVAKTVYAEQQSIPRLERLKGAYNSEFLPRFGKTAAGLELDFDSPVPPDLDDLRADLLAKAQAALAYVQAGYDGTSIVEALDLPDSLVWSGASSDHVPSAPALVPSTRADRLAELLS
jgi:HK97 family phage portal protein